MPRKIRELKADLRPEGYMLDTKRGKGSHTWWEHSDLPGYAVNVSGHDSADAKPYQERAVRDAVQRARAAKQAKRRKQGK